MRAAVCKAAGCKGANGKLKAAACRVQVAGLPGCRLQGWRCRLQAGTQGGRVQRTARKFRF